MITCPPSVLLLLQPLSKFSYVYISYIFVVLHYVFFLLIFIPFYAFFKTPDARLFITIGGIILLFSGQWVGSVFLGQSHFMLPALLAWVIFMSGTKWPYRFLSIGLLFSLMVWIRPN